jgi:hypothetical protein
VQRNTKDGPKKQLEVVTDDGKLQTWNAGLWSVVEPLIGCYTAVEYHDKPKPYPGEWLLDNIRPATDSEADAYVAGGAPRVGGSMYEQAITAPLATSSGPAATPALEETAAQVHTQPTDERGRLAPGFGSAGRAEAGSRDAAVHAQVAAKIAFELSARRTPVVDAVDSIVTVKVIKALARVFATGADDDATLAKLAAALGADELEAFALLNQMDSLAGVADEVAPAEASPSTNGNGPRVDADVVVVTASNADVGVWVPTDAQRKKLLAAGWSEHAMTVSAIAKGHGPRDPDDVPFYPATAEGTW